MDESYHSSTQPRDNCRTVLEAFGLLGCQASPPCGAKSVNHYHHLPGECASAPQLSEPHRCRHIYATWVGPARLPLLLSLGWDSPALSASWTGADGEELLLVEGKSMDRRRTTAGCHWRLMIRGKQVDLLVNVLPNCLVSACLGLSPLKIKEWSWLLLHVAYLPARAKFVKILSFMVPGDIDGCVETFGSWDSLVGRSESCGILPKVLVLIHIRRHQDGHGAPAVGWRRCTSWWGTAAGRTPTSLAVDASGGVVTAHRGGRGRAHAAGARLRSGGPPTSRAGRRRTRCAEEIAAGEVSTAGKGIFFMNGDAKVGG
jgi:hypothetical protein